MNMLQEEYVLKTRLAIAVEVKNQPVVERLEPQVMIVVQSLDALKKRIAELDVEPKIIGTLVKKEGANA